MISVISTIFVKYITLTWYHINKVKKSSAIYLNNLCNLFSISYQHFILFSIIHLCHHTRQNLNLIQIIFNWIEFITAEMKLIILSNWFLLLGTFLTILGTLLTIDFSDKNIPHSIAQHSTDILTTSLLIPIARNIIFLIQFYSKRHVTHIWIRSLWNAACSEDFLLYDTDGRRSSAEISHIYDVVKFDINFWCKWFWFRCNTFRCYDVVWWSWCSVQLSVWSL